MSSKVTFAGIVLACLAGVAIAAPADAQAPTEYGIDAGATIALGGESSIQVSLPASRFRVGFPVSPQITVEPVAGLSYTKTEGSDGFLLYDLEIGALYSLRPITVSQGDDAVTATSPYLRPFLGLTGYTGGASDSELSLGAGFGVKVPWQQNLSWRFEANVGYGFDNQAARLGLLAGLSFFPR